MRLSQSTRYSISRVALRIFRYYVCILSINCNDYLALPLSFFFLFFGLSSTLLLVSFIERDVATRSEAFRTCFYSLAGVDHQFLHRALSEYPLVTAPLLTKHVISLVYDVWSLFYFWLLDIHTAAFSSLLSFTQVVFVDLPDMIFFWLSRLWPWKDIPG